MYKKVTDADYDSGSKFYRLNSVAYAMHLFLAHDAFVRTNRRAIAMMFVRLCVWNGRACPRCAQPSFPVPRGRERGMNVQTRRRIKR